MNLKINFIKDKLKNLDQFIKQNDEADFKTFDLQDNENFFELNWKNLEENRYEILPLIKAYQRLIRIIPDQHHEFALALLNENIHSAIQIASMPKRRFIAKWSKIFQGEEELAEAIYKNATKKRSAVLLQYINLMQNNEPHIKVTRFNQ